MKVAELVSVIIPFRNAEAWLPACCESLRQQTEGRWRALLVNDGSCDASVAVATAIAAADGRFQLLHCRRSPDDAAGPWMARNLGMEHSTGRWLAFLDADDLWHPRKLELQLQALEATNAELCATAYYRFRDPGERIVACRTPPRAISRSGLVAVNPLPLSSVVVARHRIGALRFRGVVHEDHDLWQRLWALGPVPWVGLRQPLMAYRLHGNNLTHGWRTRVAMKLAWLRQREAQAQGGWGLVAAALQAGLVQLARRGAALPWLVRPQTLKQRGFVCGISAGRAI